MEQEKKEEKKWELIIKVILWGGFGSWILYSFFTEDKHQQQYDMIIAGAIYAYYNIEKRLTDILKTLEKIEQKYRG